MAAVVPPDRISLDDLDLPRLAAAMVVEAIVSFAVWQRRLRRGTVTPAIERAGRAAERFLFGTGPVQQSRHTLMLFLRFEPEDADAALCRLRDDPARLAEIEHLVKSMQCQKSQRGMQDRRERREAQHDDHD